MPLIPDISEVKERMRKVLQELPKGITLSALSKATGGEVQGCQISVFRDKGYLSGSKMRSLESALEQFGLWPPADLLNSHGN